ncbi:activating transcription factor 7-interacting protein 2 isoform X1 [Hippopotamus amphibius kiboko]|uniref:activating transcription factor 7-interacting protein 2 isoform X1 n=1 Tax=Hippopotamus amphibius kiboko TaxID=575201 RepID=UPI002592F899|nr:activating transcription factor 7-interacting protein 2 isoform X1 [Hippopotamus amphibius kiboko]XP_057604437.1 activating transcription factor 7-interacting protein 2 isoform X1 [Hippopotamus amphibius kiboko]XP_057604438.1 activating transcription factor 7-interacting protein 2 isoform X1 [Hippopotamus amphibius kiboko]XP_057604439.1 activating transcription factor 7-interacting protein 2 isoform X1 [Hippopotamus amphibius kiboko]XP_057604440.1 activating transcription factor 7-interactin
MASPDRSKRKILKAKKTMPASCRKQAKILNKLKNAEALKTAAIGSNVSSGNQNSSTGVISSKCGHSENDTSSLDSFKNSVCAPKSKVFSQNLIKPLEIVDSETRLEYTEEQVVYPYEKPSKTIESPRKLFTQKAKDSQNTSENHLECQASVTRSFFEHEEDCNLKSICCPSSVLSGVGQMSKSTITNTLDDKRIDKIVSYLETNSNSELHDKRQKDILSSDTHFVPVDKTPKLVSSVISSNFAADILKSEESCRTCHSSILSCEITDAKWLSSLDTDSNDSHNQKKRMFSENKENVKRVKTSEQINENISVALEKQTALLEQVKHLIRQEICSINYKLFDNKLKELTERIGKTQCRNKHEAIADELFARIAKVQRRIKTAASSHSNCAESNAVSSSTACKVANSETMNLDQNPESVNSPQERKTSVNSEPSHPSGKASEKINLSREHNEAVSKSNDDVMLISAENPNLTTPITSNLTDTGKITSGNSNNSPGTETEAMAVEKKKLDSVIDLTKEGLSNCNTESRVSTLESPTKAISVSKETTPVAQNAAQVLESFEHLPPLPEPPPLLPELVDKVRDTLPPQKPELKVKRVLRPRGIALTWNITKINPKCAPVESYHLFLCHENPGNKLIWKKIGEIKALPLPMACTLSQFLASNKYYFTVQSKDIFGRYGPFCDIKSIPGFSENLT